MSEVKPKFIDRVAGAFTAASIAFLPGFFLLNISPGFTGDPHPLTKLSSVADTVGLILGLLLAAIFVVAYPVERWLVRPGHSVWRIGGTYAAFFGILGAFSFLAGIATGSLTYSVFAFFGAPISAVTAFFGRAIYEKIAKFQWTNRVIALSLVSIMGAAIALPDFSTQSYPNSDFYPQTMTGEISRGTWDVNENDGAAGMHYLDSNLAPNPDLQYKIYWNCEEANGKKYIIWITENWLDGTREEIEVTCDTPEMKSINFGTEISGQKLTARISPSDDMEIENSDAYAIIAPASN